MAPEAPAVRTALLRDHPDVLAEAAAWFRSEWPDWYGPAGPGDAARDLAAFAASPDHLPLGVVALLDGRAVGIGALKATSIPSHAHLGPWAAAGYVVPACRRRGIGAALLHALCSHAQRLGHPQVYCGTSTAASLLRRAGWTALEHIVHAGRPMGIYVKATPAADRTPPPLPGAPAIALLGAADAPQYRALMLEAYVEAADAFTSTAEERQAEPLSWWVDRIASPSGRSCSFGAFVQDRLVGTVALEFNAKPKTRHSALVIGMYVSPAARRLGAGAALLQALVAEARSRPGLSHLRLTVTEGNTSAIRLYTSAGFASWGVEPEAIRTPSGFKGKVSMSLRLRDTPAPG